MNGYGYNNDEWKSEVGKAATKLIINVTMMVPIIAVAAAAAVFINNLLSSPFRLECRNLVTERRAAKPYNEAVPMIPTAPTPKTPMQAPLKVEPLYRGSPLSN